MNSTQLIQKIAAKAGLTKAQSTATIKALTTTIMQEVKAGNRVQLTGFGTFSQTQRNKRLGRNPMTGEKVNIPASKRPKFKAGKEFKQVVSGKRK